MSATAVDSPFGPTSARPAPSNPTAPHPAALNLTALGRTGPNLTAREDQVLGLIGLGMTNREIGGRLGIAEKTVKNTVTVVLAKLGLQRRTQAVIYVTVRRLATDQAATAHGGRQADH